MTAAESLLRNLVRAKKALARLMADEERVEALKELGKTYGCELFATGEIVPVTHYGNTLGYHAEFTCNNLDELIGFAGAVRAYLRRPEPADPTKPPPWEGM
jgi:hypothetical protein